MWELHYNFVVMNNDNKADSTVTLKHACHILKCHYFHMSETILFSIEKIFKNILLKFSRSAAHRDDGLFVMSEALFDTSHD